MAQPQITYHAATINYFTESLGDKITMDMVLIPAGRFEMGSPLAELERMSREELHTVTVPTFFMGRTLVTQAQWRQVAQFPAVNIKLKANPSKFKGKNRPVEKVSWDEANEFCARFSRHTSREYRLPSEAEWEYACRAGTTTPFHYGETISTDLANYNGTNEKYGAYGRGEKGIYRGETTEVGTFPPNQFGLYDMHGNLWEWCLDHWHDNYENAPIDGSAWIDKNPETDYRKVIRGGSWDFNPRNCRAASRIYSDFDYYNVGFRVVCCAPRTLT